MVQNGENGQIVNTPTKTNLRFTIHDLRFKINRVQDSGSNFQLIHDLPYFEICESPQFIAKVHNLLA